jgi:short-subunit dehydrogenase
MAAAESRSMPGTVSRNTIQCWLLEEVAISATHTGVESIPVALDLCDPRAGAILAERLRSLGRPVELLVHSAAVMSLSRVEEATVE